MSNEIDNDILDNLPCDIEDAERSEAIQNRENFEKNVSNVWGHSQLGMEAKKAAMTMLATKTGMYARIPLMCKADSCPYAESCQLLPYNLAPIGEHCPIETAQIELSYMGYAEDFDLDHASFTDKNLVSEIINYDIMINRCKALIAKEGVLVTDVVAGATEQGEFYYRPEVSKHLEAHDRLARRRNEAFQLMMATRKDKKGEGEGAQGITQVLAGLSMASYVIDEKPQAIVDAEEVK